ncbi:hypothetical protein STEPF1_04445 [Streptomyces sp. F-1]|nr:hypothetical protein STEPF1_04445 [Streptomyces sp. F-1]
MEPRQTYGRRTGRRPTPTRRSADQAPARDGRLHYTGHTTMLSQAAGHALAGELTPQRGTYP